MDHVIVTIYGKIHAIQKLEFRYLATKLISLVHLVIQGNIEIILRGVVSTVRSEVRVLVIYLAIYASKYFFFNVRTST